MKKRKKTNQCLYNTFSTNTKTILQILQMCICDVLLNFLPFVQFKEREKHPRRSVTFSKVAG